MMRSRPSPLSWAKILPLWLPVMARAIHRPMPVPPVALLPQDRILMEIKCMEAIPLWMARELSRLQIYKTSFSKYCTAYREHIIQKEGVYFDSGFLSGIV